MTVNIFLMLTVVPEASAIRAAADLQLTLWPAGNRGRTLPSGLWIEAVPES